MTRAGWHQHTMDGVGWHIEHRDGRWWTQRELDEFVNENRRRCSGRWNYMERDSMCIGFSGSPYDPRVLDGDMEWWPVMGDDMVVVRDARW